MNEETTSPNQRGAVSQFFLRLSQVSNLKNFFFSYYTPFYCFLIALREDNDIFWFYRNYLFVTDLSRLARQVDTIYKNTMGSMYRIDFNIFA